MLISGAAGALSLAAGFFGGGVSLLAAALLYFSFPSCATLNSGHRKQESGRWLKWEFAMCRFGRHEAL
jgi:hypothetical protein